MSCPIDEVSPRCEGAGTVCQPSRRSRPNADEGGVLTLNDVTIDTSVQMQVQASSSATMVRNKRFNRSKYVEKEIYASEDFVSRHVVD